LPSGNTVIVMLVNGRWQWSNDIPPILGMTHVPSLSSDTPTNGHMNKLAFFTA